jgi:hypothetical protein
MSGDLGRSRQIVVSSCDRLRCQLRRMRLSPCSPCVAEGCKLVPLLRRSGLLFYSEFFPRRKASLVSSFSRLGKAEVL